MYGTLFGYSIIHITNNSKSITYITAFLYTNWDSHLPLVSTLTRGQCIPPRGLRCLSPGCTELFPQNAMLHISRPSCSPGPVPYQSPSTPMFPPGLSPHLCACNHPVHLPPTGTAPHTRQLTIDSGWKQRMIELTGK